MECTPKNAVISQGERTSRQHATHWEVKGKRRPSHVFSTFQCWLVKSIHLTTHLEAMHFGKSSYVNLLCTLTAGLHRCILPVQAIPPRRCEQVWFHYSNSNVNAINENPS